MFEAGDKVVHPAHGAGVIAAVEQKEVLDEYSRYYVIDMAVQHMRLMVPVRTSDEIGLRAVASKKITRAALSTLADAPDDLPDDFRQRQSSLQARLREGTALAVAAVVRDMAWRMHDKPHSPTEARLYQQARNLLGGELALAQNTDVESALVQIDELVKVVEDTNTGA